MGKIVVLHTSDWHLGHQLYNRRRDEEFSAFLDWLLKTVREKSVNTLIIAGDVFDTGTPGTGAQAQYYKFLVNAASAGVRDVVITAGNHDSPAFLNAPSDILRLLRIHVIGACGENLEDEILVLKDENGEPGMIVCAVPYLREKDLKSGDGGESIADRDRRISASIGSHYAEIAALAEKIRNQADIPIIGTGHLFVKGGETGDGVRDLYVGNLGQVGSEIFGNSFDYLALGHLHRAQIVGGNELCRYSGSPLPMSFAEANQEKKVVLLEFEGRKARIEELQVPFFKKFARIHDSRINILTRLEALAKSGNDEEIWLEIQHNGEDAAGDLYREVHRIAEGTRLKLLCVKPAPEKSAPEDINLERGLEDIKPRELFAGLLEKQNIENERKMELLAAFAELEAMLVEQNGEE